MKLKRTVQCILVLVVLSGVCQSSLGKDDFSRDLYFLIQEICSDSYQLDNRYILPLDNNSFVERLEALKLVKDEALRKKVIEGIRLRMDLNATSQLSSKIGLSLATVSKLNRDASLSFLRDSLADKLNGKEPDGSSIVGSGVRSLTTATNTAILNTEAASLRSELTKVRDETVAKFDEKINSETSPKKILASKWTLIDNGPNILKSASVVFAPVENCTNLLIRVTFKSDTRESSRVFHVPSFKKGQKIYCGFLAGGDLSSLIFEAIADEGFQTRDLGQFVSGDVITKMHKASIFSAGKTYEFADPNNSKDLQTLRITKYTTNKQGTTFEAEHRGDGLVTRLEGYQLDDPLGTIVCQPYLKQGKKSIPAQHKWTIVWDEYSYGLLLKKDLSQNVFHAQ